ncbi:MAG: Gfo/Idh/MocA family oxidoreductase [Phycisphaerae bacterium]|nr:Gfo/Idh/MocA family oxidoreductase [Phycisphaerae bacterium]
MEKYLSLSIALIVMLCSLGCKDTKSDFTGAAGEVKLLTLDPGHFHAALVQKTMYDQVSPVVHVYAPEGADVQDHLNRIKGFNSRAISPTTWEEKLYTGEDFLEKMLTEKKGNVVVTSGNNSKKTDYIYKTVEAGLNVLADKPMVISPEKFDLLVQSFEKAKEKGVLIYDVMTERHEITTMLQKELANTPSLFGQLKKGTPEEPAITKESVHHFFKYVAGNPIKRPGWFFDPAQRGEGLVDVSTHLVDLIQWECFPGQIIDYKKDIQMLSAKRWGTEMTLEQFKEVTQLESFPDYLKQYAVGDKLNAISNGQMVYKIKDVHARVSVIWNYQAPEGAGDTHYSIMRGTQCNIIIQQGKEEGFKPTLYVEAIEGDDISTLLAKAVDVDLQKKYPGIRIEKIVPNKWKVHIPAKYHVGHEAHFAQVTKKYLGYLQDGKLPDWEVPNMIAKYYTTTQALQAVNK